MASRTAIPWQFRTRFRRGAFGWRGSAKAIERIEQALAEILAAARSDPAGAAEGAVLLLCKVSPALEGVDSSSGALGSCTWRMVDALVPVIATAPVTQTVRAKWLEQLFEAYQEDDPPYIESLGEHWGELCASPELARAWADELLPMMQHVMQERRGGAFALAKAGAVCWSALFTAGRHEELLQTLALDPRPFWHDQQWVARVLQARGDIDGAIAWLEGLRGNWAPDMALSAMCEQMLLDAGRTEEAYARYGLNATRANTHLATFRAIARKYPAMPPQRLLADLVAASPGEEAKWFAAARSLKQLDLALALARRGPVQPRTLLTAAKAELRSQPEFALEVALIALRAIAGGLGYEVTGADVLSAIGTARAAAEALGRQQELSMRMAQATQGAGVSARWVRQVAGLPEG